MKLNNIAERLGTLSWLWMQKHWFISGLALLVGSCAFMTRDRTVTWEEEVPLNTGETIVVKRTGRYIDFDYDLSQNRLGYKPDPVSTIEFAYKGKRYEHTNDAMLMLLVIAQDGRPNLVAEPTNHDWHWKNKYYCVNPFYVQFVPNEAGNKWNWPEKIDSWLYGRGANLTPGLLPLSDNKKKLTAAEVQKILRSVNAGYPEFLSIDIKYVVTNKCPRRN